jgi:hypothetical protein
MVWQPIVVDCYLMPFLHQHSIQWKNYSKGQEITWQYPKPSVCQLLTKLIWEYLALTGFMMSWWCWQWLVREPQWAEQRNEVLQRVSPCSKMMTCHQPYLTLLNQLPMIAFQYNSSIEWSCNSRVVSKGMQLLWLSQRMSPCSNIISHI